MVGLGLNVGLSVVALFVAAPFIIVADLIVIGAGVTSGLLVGGSVGPQSPGLPGLRITAWALLAVAATSGITNWFVPFVSTGWWATRVNSWVTGVGALVFFGVDGFVTAGQARKASPLSKATIFPTLSVAHDARGALVPSLSLVGKL